MTAEPKSSGKRRISRTPRNFAHETLLQRHRIDQPVPRTNGGHTDATRYKPSWSFESWWFERSPRRNCLLSVSAPSPALARPIFEFRRNRRSYEEARGATRCPRRAIFRSKVEGAEEQDESADWRIWDRRDPEGYTELLETRGVRVDARGWPTPPTSLTPPSRVGPPPSLVFHLLHHPGLLQSRRRATRTLIHTHTHIYSCHRKPPPDYTPLSTIHF